MLLVWIYPPGISPPELVGIADRGGFSCPPGNHTPLSTTNQSGLYSISGAASLIVILTLTATEPPELLAQIVYITGSICKIVGVPQMVPLLDSKFRPAGKSGLISQLVTAPPVGDTVLGVIA